MSEDKAAQVSQEEAFVNGAMEAPETTVTDQATQADPAPAQEQVESPAEPDGVQKRINKITADKYEEKRRADALQAQLDAMKQQQPQTQAAPVVEPKLEDFDFDEAKYQAALVQHEVQKQIKQFEDSQRQQQQQVQQQQVNQRFNEKVAEFSSTATDYNEVVQNLPQLPKETLDAVLQMDNGPQVAYFLGKHLDVADEIASSSPMVAAMRLGEIKAQLSNAKPNPKPSAAPAPIEPVTSGGSVSKSYDEMSMEEIMKLR